ncbi:hypothetical protein ACHAW5_001320 [Stephanodiscus triporus]|uniref:Beta-galactosidase n=1 Tax=Stephanodiscus triporus TaxID=2934178 RepID=A0ABD3N2Z4_9STRA
MEDDDDFGGGMRGYADLRLHAFADVMVPDPEEEEMSSSFGDYNYDDDDDDDDDDGNPDCVEVGTSLFDRRRRGQDGEVGRGGIFSKSGKGTKKGEGRSKASESGSKSGKGGKVVDGSAIDPHVVYCATPSKKEGSTTNGGLPTPGEVQGFEVGDIPFVANSTDPAWTTNPVLGGWYTTDEKSFLGDRSARSPDLHGPRAESTMAVALPDYGVGELRFHVLAGIQLPFDAFEWYVDGELVGEIEMPTSGFEERVAPLGPGPHVVEFVYVYNPGNSSLVESMPEETVKLAYPFYIGAVYIDDVYFFGTSTPSTPPPPTAPPIVGTMPPTPGEVQGFEMGGFPLDVADPIWTTDPALGGWYRTDERPFLGERSVRSPDLDGPRAESTLAVSLPDYGTGELRFRVLAGIQLPFDAFEWYVDGELVGEIVTPTSEFEERVVPLGPGPHVVEFVYVHNPRNSSLVENMPEETIKIAYPFYIGAVYIDDVYFFGTSPPSTGWYVDGELVGEIVTPTSEFEERVVPLGPGPHVVEFVYVHNPRNSSLVENMPEETIKIAYPFYIGAVYIDDVYFFGTSPPSTGVH